ncbi:MAG: hypothetical protein ACW99G_06835 [Candidatus Thorarchaeota archaeon]
MSDPDSPQSPSRVLTTAFKMAMAITLALARDRASGKSRPLYFGQGNRIKGMARVWNERKKRYKQTFLNGCPDASVLLRIEHAIRRSFSRILLKTSVRYGNTETKRVKREEGVKGYLNILWDYAGSQLRDVTKSRYSFPKPREVEKLDGTSDFGYRGTKHTPFYPVRHNHLPELDFGDMIRSPLMEGARQCLKYGVPINTAKIYIDALLFRLIPFLDYVYTERRSGRSNYIRDGLKELRAVVDLIKEDYGTRNGVRQSITSETDELTSEEILSNDNSSEVETLVVVDEKSKKGSEKEENPEEDTHYLEEVIKAAIEEGVVLNEDHLQTAERLLADGILRKRDSEELLREMQEQSRKIGVRIHRFVSRNFQSPFSINGVINHGTDMTYDDSGLVLLSEVPVDGGRGRVDLVLARAKKLTRVDGAPSVVICEPFMVVDLKTKNAFDFDIYGIESRSTHKKNVVPKFILDHRGLTQDEWENVLSITPDEYEETQLDLYETAFLRDYEQVMWKDNDAQKRLAKAVLVVDSHQSWKDISESILPLFLNAYEGCVDGTLSAGDILFPSDKGNRLRIAMRMLSVSSPSTDTVEVNPPLAHDPFGHRVEDRKEFVFYLTVSGSGSPAQSAASIAERWHGLQYVHGLARGSHRDMFWLDLLGEYTDPILREDQFRLKSQTDPIRQFFGQQVRMNDLSECVREVVYGEGTMTALRTKVNDLLNNCQEPLVVVSGWETLRHSTPGSHSKFLDEIVMTIMQSLPAESTVVWFARPVPIAQNSIEYSTRCVAPFYQGTLWQNFADTIVWNVPMPPDRSRTRVSTNYHERCIFIERPERSLESEVIEVEPLRGWHLDFQSGGPKGREVYHSGAGSPSHQSVRYIERQSKKAMRIIPHLLPYAEYNPGPRSNTSLVIEPVRSGYETKQDDEDEVPPRLTFRPTQIHADTEIEDEKVDGRVETLLPMDAINRRREYRQMTLDVPHRKRNTRPPSERFLVAGVTDDHRIALTEIRNMRNTIRFLDSEEEHHLSDLLDQLSKVLDNKEEENGVEDIEEGDSVEDTHVLMNRLWLIRQTLELNVLSESVWRQLLPLRSVIPRNLSKEQREHVTAIQTRHPDILLTTGNHLFLMILSAIGKTSDRSNRESLVSLWEYVRPWHLMGLGLRPEYHANHHTGRSVLDRHALQPHLELRFMRSNMTRELQSTLMQVKFGQVVTLQSSTNYLWLLFQRTPGIYEMNAALLNPQGIDTSLSLSEKIREMVSGKTFWSESDLSLLSKHTEELGGVKRLSVMVAEQQGVQGLWIMDRTRKSWTPVGRLHYTTRRHEDVTLVRTISLSADLNLRPVGLDDVRRPVHRVEEMISDALFIVGEALEGCTPVMCKVTLDTDERMFRVSFNDKDSGGAVGEILINRTIDLLEILRRPDNECEPVIIDGKRLIWNRFRDISYDEDVALLRPWVDRRDPFPGMPLMRPPTADSLINAVKEFDITLELYHDPLTCPLRHISLEDVENSHKRARTSSASQHMLRFVSHWGEPAHISNEPGIHHGSCWRVHVVTPHKLTPELKELTQIRLTDGQTRSLLSPQELVYWSEKEQRWITHTFRIVVQKDCINEVKESWHLRVMLTDLTGERFEPTLPGVDLQNPVRWEPYIAVRPDHVQIGLRERSTGLESDKIIPQQNVALMDKEEVQKLLEREMLGFLESSGIEADRILSSSIQTEIAASMDIAGVSDDAEMVQLDKVTIEQDTTGGRILYVVLISEVDVHKIPVTGHLHNIRQIGRYKREKFESEVESSLSEFNLSGEDRARAVKECVRVMRKEKLVTR